MPPHNNTRPNANPPPRPSNSRPPVYSSANPPPRQSNSNPPPLQSKKNPPARQNKNPPPNRPSNNPPPNRPSNNPPPNRPSNNPPPNRPSNNPPPNRPSNNPPPNRPSDNPPPNSMFNNPPPNRPSTLQSPDINVSDTQHDSRINDTRSSKTLPNIHPSSQKKNNTQRPVIKNSNVIKPITISLILGAFFIILNIFILIIFTNGSTVSNVIVSFIGVFIVMFLFLICIIYIIVLNGKKIKLALQKIAIIMSITFGATLLLLLFSNNGKYPFINVFENSIGFFICSSIYGSSLNKLFKFKNNLFNDGEQFQPNKNVLLTLFSLENFDNLYDNFTNTDNKYNFIIDNSDISILGDNDPNHFKKYLKSIVAYKNTIGILGWFYITSFFTTLVSIKYLSYV